MRAIKKINAELNAMITRFEAKQAEAQQMGMTEFMQFVIDNNHLALTIKAAVEIKKELVIVEDGDMEFEDFKTSLLETILQPTNATLQPNVQLEVQARVELSKKLYSLI